ncbi:UbiA family prenyltransferase [Sphingomonas cavernae]|nr:UbiA family prenyltransferase [Sphingomonas cavernae]
MNRAQRSNTLDNKAQAQVPGTGLLGLARDALMLMRVHHWQKNILVFVPMLVSREFGMASLGASITAFLAFSLAASSAYVLNDLIDAEADRLHQFKRERPIARGAISRAVAIGLILGLAVAAFAVAALLPIEFVVVLGVYYCATCLYSVIVKRMLGLDVVVLALLYTLRVIAGDEAIGSDSSEWIIAFSLFFFLALALVKRFTELSYLLDAGGTRAPSRAYRVEDLRVMVPLAAASGFSAITIFTRFIGSEDVLLTYSHPERLWYIAPVLIYWLIRLMLLANRLKVRDDPVVYATGDLKSLLCGGAVAGILVWAW